MDYDWTTHTGSGRRKMAGKPGASNYRPVERPANTPLPCQVQDEGAAEGTSRCPKGSPAEEKSRVLNERNRKALEFYRRVKATGGKALTEAMAQDGALQKNFAIIDDIVRAAEQRELARAIARQLPVMAMPK